MTGLRKKGLIFLIILFFISAGAIPNISGNIENKSSRLSAKQIFTGKDLSYQLLTDVQETHKLTYYGYELDQFQTNEGNIGFDVGYFYLTQSFKPSMTPLVKVDLFGGYTTPSGNTLEVSIREYLNGDDLTCVSLPANEIPSHLAWFECDFPDIDVEPEKTYYIVINQIGDGKYTWQGTQGNEHYDRGFSYSCQKNTQDWVNLSELFSNFDFCFKTYSYGDNLPPNTPIINGSISGKAGKGYEYEFYTIDPEGDDVLFMIDWGDGITSEWFGPYKSGEKTNLDHTWEEKGEYTIKVKSKDIFGDKSDWGTLEISMPKNKAFNPLLQFLERLMEQFPMLEKILLLNLIN